MRVVTVTLFTILFTLLSTGAQAQDWYGSLLSGFRTENYNRTYTIDELAILGGPVRLVVDGLELAETGANDVINKIPKQFGIKPVNLTGVTDPLTKENELSIRRILLSSSYVVGTDGFEAELGVDIGWSSSNILSVGARASARIDAGIANHFGAGLEPISLGTFTRLEWYRAVALGVTVGASTESMFFNKQMDNSFDIRVQLVAVNDRARKDKRIVLYSELNLPLTPNASKRLVLGLAYQLASK